MNNEELIARIEKLEKWKLDRERQQITLPLDVTSQLVLQQYFMRIVDTIITEGGAGGNTFVQYLGKQGDKEFLVGENTYTPYIVNTTTNVLTTSGTKYFEDDMQVYVATSNTPPAPLDPITTYFVISSNGTAFKLSLTQGGAEIDITDTGVGNQYIYFF